ncbi:MAG: methionine--tRNA ligase subunit beta, partial [Bacteroidota bacterium]
VPPLDTPSGLDMDVLAQLAGFPKRIGDAYDAYRMREAVFETMALARLGNKYFNDTEPWHTRKTDLRACGNTIHVSLQLCAALAVLMEPVLPGSAAKLREMLKLTGVRPSTPDAPRSDAAIDWDRAGASLLDEGHALGEPAILFTKIDDDVIAAQVAKLGTEAMPGTVTPTVDPTAETEERPAGPEAEALPYAPVGDTIEFADFMKLDLRVGVVKVAERVPKTDKLLRLEVDLGFEERQILAGLAQHLDADDLVGRRVVVVANLKPRKMRGLESQGMVLAAEDRDGRLVPVGGADAEPGAQVR